MTVLHRDKILDTVRFIMDSLAAKDDAGFMLAKEQAESLGFEFSIRPWTFDLLRRQREQSGPFGNATATETEG